MMILKFRDSKSEKVDAVIRMQNATQIEEINKEEIQRVEYMANIFLIIDTNKK